MTENIIADVMYDILPDHTHGLDLDPQGNMTSGLGVNKNELENTVYELMLDECSIKESMVDTVVDGMKIIPSNVNLAGAEIELLGIEDKEYILKNAVDYVRDDYDFIIIDCMPSLGMLTINALACADSVLIPVQAAYLPVKGLQQLIKTIGRVKKQLNPKLKIEGILLTMVDNRTNYARDISLMVYDTYSASIKVFGTEIPMSVRASEVSVEGGSIYSYDPKGKAAFAYMALTKEVLKEAE